LIQRGGSWGIFGPGEGLSRKGKKGVQVQRKGEKKREGTEWLWRVFEPEALLKMTARSSHAEKTISKSKPSAKYGAETTCEKKENFSRSSEKKRGEERNTRGHASSEARKKTALVDLVKRKHAPLTRTPVY